MVGMDQPAIKASMEAALRARQKLAMQYRHVFAGQPGEEVLRDLERFAGAEGEPFEPGRADVTAYNLGKLAIVRYIQKQLKERNHGSE